MRRFFCFPLKLGHYSRYWDASAHVSGIYFVKMMTSKIDAGEVTFHCKYSLSEAQAITKIHYVCL